MILDLKAIIMNQDMGCNEYPKNIKLSQYLANY